MVPTASLCSLIPILQMGKLRLRRREGGCSHGEFLTERACPGLCVPVPMHAEGPRFTRGTGGSLLGGAQGCGTALSALQLLASVPAGSAPSPQHLAGCSPWRGAAHRGWYSSVALGN